MSFEIRIYSYPAILKDKRFDGRKIESAVRVKCRFPTESYSTEYRTIRHTMTEKDWRDYVPEEAVDLFEDFSKYPFDAETGAIYEV